MAAKVAITAFRVGTLCWLSALALAQQQLTVLNPPYFNIAENRPITANATCGEGGNIQVEVYCKLVGFDRLDEDLQNFKVIDGQICDECFPYKEGDSSVDFSKTHPANNAVDGDINTHWQSPPISRGSKYNRINIDIDLIQEFQVAYIVVTMADSPRPGVWALEKSNDHGKTYKPWQFFASNDAECFKYFGIHANVPISEDDSVICSTDFSKVPPFEGGEVFVALTSGRPSEQKIQESDMMMEWLRATNIRLKLMHTKTMLGHLMKVAQGDKTVTRRYYYTIKEIQVGGKCICNGHAFVCPANRDNPLRLTCICSHKTAGDMCDRCSDGYMQKKWRKYTKKDPFECEACNCNGHSDKCHYNATVDELSMSMDLNGNMIGGGVCEECQHYTTGINCDSCVDGYFRPPGVLPNATDPCIHPRPTTLPPDSEPFTGLTVEPQDVTSSQDEEVRLVCRVDGSGFTMRWSKRDGRLPYTATDNKGVLIISMAKAEDSGIYVCTVTSPTGTVQETQARVTILAYRGPPTAWIEQEDQTIGQGSTATLKCTAAGAPSPAVTWSKVGEALNSPNVMVAGNTLTVRNAAVSDRGMYICTAQNHGGSARASAIIEVERREPPSIEIYPDVAQTVTVGASVLFQCRALTGIPTPRITWSRVDGKAINQDNLIRDVIRINQVTSRDVGQYKCTAENDAGSTEGIATLTTQEMPTVTMNPAGSVTVQLGKSLNIQCNVQGDPRPTIRWQQLGVEREDPGLTGHTAEMYSIRSATKQNNGTYACIATNSAGEMEDRLQVIVTDPRVELRGGSTPNEGNVYALNSLNNLGPVCDDNWGDEDARVVCRQLGYSGGRSTTESHFGSVSSTFAMDEVRCNGEETQIQDCQHSTNDDCGDSEGAGVKCFGCTNGWFDYPNCKPCSCSSFGSKNETCNKETGECYCKEYYHGRSCSYHFDQNYGKNTRIAGPNDFIVKDSGQNSQGSWPWGASIGWIDGNGLWQHFCSGVIVSPNKVLTTANCLKSLNDDERMGIDLTNITITAGDTLLKSRRHDQHMQRRGFLKFKIHPGYVYDMHYLDIAVITLKNLLLFNEHVRPVYLPSPIEAKKQVGMENVLLSISGWGKGGDGKAGERLKDAVVTVFNNGYCISTYRGYRLDKLFTEDIFCGGNPVGLTEVCEGDDGSPAVLLDHKLGRYVLVGLLSMSNEFSEGYYDSPVCGTTETPNIFVRVSSESIITFLHREIYGDLDPYLPTILTPHYDLECGRKTSNSSTDVGKWPWMVSLGTAHPDNPEEWLHFCGGSLVSATKVITAAHCTRRYNGNFTVRAGDGNLRDSSDDDQVQTSLLESIDNHPEYRYRYFDIAVLTLEEPLEFMDAVRPVCLNTLENIGEKDDETSTHLVVSGWGDGTQMKETTVMIMSELMCNKTHELRRHNKNLVPNLFTDDVMCAADPAGESGTCQGDSGGPAVYFDTRKMRYHLRGVVGGSARGICGSYDFPNVYVRVESKSVLKWIQGIINK